MGRVYNFLIFTTGSRGWSGGAPETNNTQANDVSQMMSVSTSKVNPGSASTMSTMLQVARWQINLYGLHPYSDTNLKLQVLLTTPKAIINPCRLWLYLGKSPSCLIITYRLSLIISWLNTDSRMSPGMALIWIVYASLGEGLGGRIVKI